MLYSYYCIFTTKFDKGRIIIKNCLRSVLFLKQRNVTIIFALNVEQNIMIAMHRNSSCGVKKKNTVNIHVLFVFLLSSVKPKHPTSYFDSV